MAADAGEWDFYGSLRVRTEMIDGQARFPFRSSDAIVALRTILGARYTSGNLTLGAELRDGRIYGDVFGSAVTNADVNAVELVGLNASLAFPGALGAGRDLSVSAGRMTMALGSGRLIDAPNFRNTSNGFTGVRMNAEMGEQLDATLFWALPEFRQPASEQGVLANAVQWDNVSLGRQIWGLDLAGASAADERLSWGFTYVGLIEKRAPIPLQRRRFLHTFGPRAGLAPQPGRFDANAEAFVQLGEIRPVDGGPDESRPVRAWTLHAAAGYTFDRPWRPRLSVQYDQATGAREGDRFTRFDRLFGFRVADFGPSGLYSAVGRQNIASPSVRLSVAPGSRWIAQLNARALWADSATDAFSTTNVIDPSGEPGRWAGWQVDSRSQYWLVPERLRWELNLVWLQKEGLLLEAPNATPGNHTLYVASALTSFF
jgi:hypothetical protein